MGLQGMWSAQLFLGCLIKLPWPLEHPNLSSKPSLPLILLFAQEHTVLGSPRKSLLFGFTKTGNFTILREEISFLELHWRHSDDCDCLVRKHKNCLKGLAQGIKPLFQISYTE